MTRYLIHSIGANASEDRRLGQREELDEARAAARSASRSDDSPVTEVWDTRSDRPIANFLSGQEI